MGRILRLPKEDAYNTYGQKIEVPSGEVNGGVISESTLYLNLTVKSNGTVTALGMITYTHKEGFIFLTKAIMNDVVGSPEVFLNPNYVRLSNDSISRSYYWNTALYGESPEAVLNISVIKEGAWSVSDSSYISVNLNKLY